MTSTKVKSVRSGVFIDGSNIFWACKNLPEAGKQRWELDYFKVKEYLTKRYSPLFYKYYGCVDEKPSNQTFITKAAGANVFHNKLSGYGYDVILKPLKYIKDKRTGEVHTKGDMDVAISIDIKNSLKDIDNVIIFSGDSDFLPLITDAHQMGKHIRIYAFGHNLAWELKDFAIKNIRCSYKLLDECRKHLEYEGKKYPQPPLTTIRP